MMAVVKKKGTGGSVPNKAAPSVFDEYMKPATQPLQEFPLSATTKVVFADKSEMEYQELLGHLTTNVPVAHIGLRAGQTLNLGNYNSAKIEVSVMIPCLVSRLDAAYDFAYAFCDKKMELLAAEVKPG
jgi:hypothetical protein